MKTAKLEGDRIVVRFDYDPILVTAIKLMPMRRWMESLRCWTLPVSLEIVHQLEVLGFVIDPNLHSWVGTVEHPNEIAPNLNLGDLEERLYHFQKQGVYFIQQKGGRALLADEMGLGKTIQAIAWVRAARAFPAIVVCPASLKLNWDREWAGWAPEASVTVLSTRKAESVLQSDVYILNYDILAAWIPYLKQLSPDCLILDETHFCKNWRAVRSKAALTVAKYVKHVIALSGTPIINRPWEIWTTLKMVSPELFPQFWEFAQRYCGLHRNAFGWDWSGATNTKELHTTLTGTLMIRRLKKDVLKELPDKTQTIIPVEIKNRSEYDAAERDFIQWLMSVSPDKVESAVRATAFAKIEALKRLCVVGKMDSINEWIEDFFEECQDEKLVCFCTHHIMVDELAKWSGSVKLDGRDSLVQRQKAVDRFQNDPAVGMFVGTTKAAGVGITLTMASNVLFVELGWTPGEHQQAADRLHRIGQKNAVMVYYMVAKNTIEDRILRLLNEKAKILGSVLDGKDEKDSALVTEIMNDYRNRKEG